MKRPVFAGLLLLPLVLPLAFLTGCYGYSAGGQRTANDLFTYESLPESPTTVVVRDWTNDRVFLNIDIPAGEQLVMQFHKNKNQKHDPTMPDTMHWRLMPLGQRAGSLTNAMPVTDENHRIVDVYATGKAPGQATAGR